MISLLHSLRIPSPTHFLCRCGECVHNPWLKIGRFISSFGGSNPLAYIFLANELTCPEVCGSDCVYCYVCAHVLVFCHMTYMLCPWYCLQLRSFRMKFAEMHGRFATAAKLLEEEMAEKGPSRAQETQLIKVEGWERNLKGQC